MLDVVWKYYQQCIELRLCDCFDDEPLIVTKEKETATLACSFTSVKYLLTIVCWQKAGFNYADVDVEKVVNFHELNVLMKSNRDRQIKFLSKVITLARIACC